LPSRKSTEHHFGALLIALLGQVRSSSEPLFGNGLNLTYRDIGILEALCSGKLLILFFLLVG
jgi:hypothetical protein